MSAGTTDGLPLDAQQRFELLLTAVQSLFAVSILITLSLSLRGAAALFVLFAVQFVASITLPASAGRIVIVMLSAVYGALALALFVQHRRTLLRTTKDGLVTGFDELERADAEAASR